MTYFPFGMYRSGDSVVQKQKPSQEKSESHYQLFSFRSEYSNTDIRQSPEITKQAVCTLPLFLPHLADLKLTKNTIFRRKTTILEQNIHLRVFSLAASTGRRQELTDCSEIDITTPPAPSHHEHHPSTSIIPPPAASLHKHAPHL